MIGLLAKAWRQFWCQHAFNVEDIQRSSEDPRGNRIVLCHCRRCMKLFTAPYGLALPGRITRRGGL